MILNRLNILNYKNIADADLRFSPKLNLFVGQNGEGKTNVLDAIYFLSLCKSYTCHQDAQCIRHGEQMAMLQGAYEHEDGTPEEIYLGMRSGQKKILRRNQKTYSRLSDHIGLIPVVMVSPVDSLLLSGGSEERRRFMDLVISQMNRTYMVHLGAYNTALASRNAMLKQEQVDAGLLEIWEQQMADHAGYIYRCREEYVTQFVPIFQHFYSTISSDKEHVGLRYESHLAEGDLADMLAQVRQRDHILGYTTRGIHRDDLAMTLGGYPIRTEGSQGQNKTLLIALKLAQFDFLKRTGSATTPLLLLDDIFDKLDAERVEQIMHLVASEAFGQIFVTDTNRAHLDEIVARVTTDHRLFTVRAGMVSADR